MLELPYELYLQFQDLLDDHDLLQFVSTCHGLDSEEEWKRRFHLLCPEDVDLDDNSSVIASHIQRELSTIVPPEYAPIRFDNWKRKYWLLRPLFVPCRSSTNFYSTEYCIYWAARMGQFTPSMFPMLAEFIPEEERHEKSRRLANLRANGADGDRQLSAEKLLVCAAHSGSLACWQYVYNLVGRPIILPVDLSEPAILGGNKEILEHIIQHCSLETLCDNVEFLWYQLLGYLRLGDLTHAPSVLTELKTKLDEAEESEEDILIETGLDWEQQWQATLLSGREEVYTWFQGHSGKCHEPDLTWIEESPWNDGTAWAPLDSDLYLIPKLLNEKLLRRYLVTIPSCLVPDGQKNKEDDMDISVECQLRLAVERGTLTQDSLVHGYVPLAMEKNKSRELTEQEWRRDLAYEALLVALHTRQSHMVQWLISEITLQLYIPSFVSYGYRYIQS